MNTRTESISFLVAIFHSLLFCYSFAGEEPKEKIAPQSNLVDAEEIDFESRKYKIVHSSGFFSTFGIPDEGYILEFNPRKLMSSKPSAIHFEERKAYLNLTRGNFELLKTNTNQFAKFKSYSFISKGELGEIRFNVIYDRSMIITYESEGIIVGVVVLDTVNEKIEQDSTKHPATQLKPDSVDGDKPKLESEGSSR
jgi:hypothetical protein